MAEHEGFWSYVHRDDEHEHGRIKKLSQLVADRIAFLTGDEFRIFVDRTDLQWGDDWEQHIDEALLSTTFLFPVLTPRYLLSQECRRELLLFSRAATDLGLEELVLSILYTETPALDRDVDDDEVVTLLTRFQWQSFQVEALEDEESSVHRKGVDRLAREIIRRMNLADAKPSQARVHSQPSQVPTTISEPGNPVQSDDHDDPTSEEEEGGILDTLAQGEAALPGMTAALDALTELIENLNRIVSESGEAITRSDAAGKGFVGRLQVSRELAKQMDEIADQLEPLVRKYIDDLFLVDSSTRLILQLLQETNEVEEGMPFIRSVLGLANASQAGIEFTVTLANSLFDNRNFSKDLRDPSKRLETSLRQMVDAQSIFADWIRQIRDLVPGIEG